MSRVSVDGSFGLSGKRREQLAAARKDLAGEMSSGEMAEAERWAREWKSR